MQKIIASFILIAFLSFDGIAGGDQEMPQKHHWSFDGMSGKLDKISAQRGFQVYKEVCAACHSLKRIAFRNLEEIGFSTEEVKSLAASYSVVDGPNDAGEMFERAGKASDHFPSPYANDNAARAANNGALPPDLSLIIKARHDGANYVHSLLNGYKAAPENVHLSEGMHFNPYFPGMQIAMTPPLTEGQVTYSDGTVATVDQMSKDVVNFLQWTSEPEMEKRHNMGIQTVIYLIFFTLFFYFAKRKIWSRVK